jgi:hypothetical protein
MAKVTYKELLQEVQTETEGLKTAVQQATEEMAIQVPVHRAALLKLVQRLTIASFIFLVFVVIFQMLWKIRHPEYQVISDAVINILAVGVFAELVGVVGILAKLVWKR